MYNISEKTIPGREKKISGSVLVQAQFIQLLGGDGNAKTTSEATFFDVDIYINTLCPLPYLKSYKMNFKVIERALKKMLQLEAIF